MLGDEEERDATLEGLRVLAWRAPGAIAREMRMKRTPTLNFVYDDSRRAGRAHLAAARGRGLVSEATDARRRRDLDEVVEELRAGERFLLTTHEGPDGDALGSLLAMHHVLEPARQGLGDVPRREGVPAPGRVPVPAARGGLPRAARRHLRPHGDLPRLRQHRPDAGRLPAATAAACSTSTTTTTTPASATVNLVDVEASCTAEIVFELAEAARRRDDAEIADALYVGLVTDTGKFMYENTDARSHRMAAGLIEAGVDVNEIYRRLYEHVPIEKLKLIARALERIERLTTAALSITYISADDYAATGADEALTEGIIDSPAHDRGDAGGRGRPRQARQRARGAQGQPALHRRRVDVSAIARETAAAGTARRRLLAPTSSYERAGRVPQRRGRRAARQLTAVAAGAAAAGVLLLRQAGGGHLARRGRPGAARASGCKVGHAGTLDPFATGLLIVLLGAGHPAAALPARPAEDLPGDAPGSAGARPPAIPTASSPRPGASPSGWSCRPARSSSGCR